MRERGKCKDYAVPDMVPARTVVLLMGSSIQLNGIFEEASNWALI